MFFNIYQRSGNGDTVTTDDVAMMRVQLRSKREEGGTRLIHAVFASGNGKASVANVGFSLPHRCITDGEVQFR